MLRQALGVVGLVVLCAALGCEVSRARRPDGPYREAYEFVDHFSDEAVACVKTHELKGRGHITVASDLSRANRVPKVEDWGSLEGSQAVVECIRKNVAEKLRTPSATPGRYARVRVPVPLDKSGVSYAFAQERPSTTR